MANPRHPRSTAQRREFRRKARRREGEALRPWLAGLGIGVLLIFAGFLAYKFLGGETVFPLSCSGATHIFLMDGGKYTEAEAAERILDDIVAAVSAVATGERVVISRIGGAEAPGRRVAEFCNSPAARETLREKIAAALARPQAQGQSPIVEAIENAERDFRTAYNTPKALRHLHIYSGMVQDSPWWSMARLAAPDWCDLRKFREARVGAVTTLGRPIRIHIWNVDIHWIKHPMDFEWHKNEAEIKCFWENYLSNSAVTWEPLNALRPREPIRNPLRGAE